MASTVTALAATTFTGSIPAIPAGVQAAALFEQRPDPVTLKTALAANPEVNEDFSVSGFSDLLGILAMSLAYPGDGSGLSKTFEAELSLVLDPGSLSTPQNLMIGLLDPIAAGTGFDSLTFQIKRGTVFVVNQTFTDLATALTFLTTR